MTSFQRIAALGLANALALTVVVGIAQAHLDRPDASLTKTDRAPLAAVDPIVASFALFETGAIEFQHPAGGVTVVTRSVD